MQKSESYNRAGSEKRNRKAAGPEKRNREAAGSEQRNRKAAGSEKRNRKAAGPEQRNRKAAGPERSNNSAAGALRAARFQQLPSVLVPWYEENGRELPWRTSPEPYHVWVSEIMLQQTRIEAVKPYYARFLKEIPDIGTLADADPEHLHKLWEGLGYYSRVRNLQAAARQIMEENGGIFPSDYEEIRRLKGIGEYTAGAIASICFEKPTPALDGNVLRVLARITDDTRPVSDEKTRRAVREELAAVYPEGKCGSFTQALMELGEIVCLPNGAPDCAHCPCRTFCASADGGWEKLPVKAEKKDRRKEDLTVFLLHCGGFTALHKREETGLLSGMWEFPNVEGDLTGSRALQQAIRWKCSPAAIEGEGRSRHVFTHVEWNMHCYAVACEQMPPVFAWVDAAKLQEEIALPTAFRRLLSLEFENCPIEKPGKKTAEHPTEKAEKNAAQPAKNAKKLSTNRKRVDFETGKQKP